MQKMKTMKRGTFANKQFELDNCSVSVKFRYMLLDRMLCDCDYFLVSLCCKYLWAGDTREQIKDMISLWLSLPVKPEWLTVKKLDFYSVLLTGQHLKKFGVKVRF